jgi:tripartite-type tricarboxylate transporter receptor subunit TctC
VPNVPTLRELGYDVVNGSVRGYVARKGIPARKREALLAGFKKVLADAAFRDLALKDGVTLDGRMGKEYGDYMAGMVVEYGPIIEEAKKKHPIQ